MSPSTLFIHRSANDLAESSLLSLETTGVMARAIRGQQVATVVAAAMLALLGVLLGDWPLVGAGLVMIAVLPLLVPHALRRQTRRRAASQCPSHVAAWTGSRTLMATDTGLSDVGAVLSISLAWTAVTDLVAMPDRYVVIADGSVTIDIPRRGDLAAVDTFATLIGSHVENARRHPTLVPV